jgi:two-component system, sensor histidine kinase and response regulator
MISASGDAQLKARADEILRLREQQIYRRIDRMFAVLMIIQWVGAVGTALCVSPRTWSGATSSLHPHVWFAFWIGGVLASLPVWLAWRRPGATVTRYTIAVAQMLFSSLLVQVSGGRLETHFHVFGSLAFLAAYRDWGVLMVATSLVGADHLIRGIFWPQSVFGVATADEWRWVEHTGWVLFEDLFLLITMRKSMEEMQNNALQTALFESHHEDLERYSKQLHRSFEKERSIIEGSLDAVVELDSRGKVLNWNGPAERLFGWSVTEAVGQQLDELVIPEQDRLQYLEGLRQLGEQQDEPTFHQRFEMECVARNGRQFDVELAIVSIQGSEEMTFCAFVRDITDRKSHELDMRRAMEEAEAANRTKSEFLANMSHEIRTPLNSILGFAELLVRNADEGDERTRRDYAETIRTSARHLLELINNVLDLSKIEAGKMQVEHARFSPHQVIAEVVSLMRVRAVEKGVVLNYRWDSPIPETIATDPHRIRQLLINLVGNAIKFTEQGSVMIVARAQRESDHCYLILEVRDTGIGIERSKLDDIFHPFVQADSSMTRRYGGTGLGLAICKNIAAALGGNLSVDSEIGKGTTFTIRIAIGDLRHVRMLESPPETTTGDYVDRPSSANLQGVRVLLADDGETNRKLIQVFLSRHGADVQTVENGEMACRLAVAEEYDVILMDMQMPQMDGYAAARKLRSIGYEKPIIALTAHAMKGDREKCTYAGCSGYLSKPVNVDELVRQVEAAVGLGERCRVDLKSEKERKIKRALSGPIRSSLPTEDELLHEIVSEFVESIPARLEAMERALAEENYEELQQHVHGLKGSGGTAGFTCLSEVSAELEAFAAEKRGDQAAALLGELREMEQLIVV